MQIAEELEINKTTEDSCLLKRGCIKTSLILADEKREFKNKFEFSFLRIILT